MKLLKNVKLWFAVVGVVLSVVMAVALDATFTEWIGGFLSITAAYAVGSAGIKRVKGGRTST